MPPNKNEDMTKEEVYDDVMVFNFGQVMDAHQYLKSMAEQVHEWGVDVVLFVSGIFCLLAVGLYARRVPVISRVVRSINECA